MRIAKVLHKTIFNVCCLCSKKIIIIIIYHYKSDNKYLTLSFFFYYLRNYLSWGNCKICRCVTIDGVYISTGNDIFSYLWSAANCTKVLIVGHVHVEIS